MAEKSQVIAAIMRTSVFKNRVRAIVANKAMAILSQEAPNADQLAWAKAAVGSGYDAWVESLLILVSTQPATVNAAITATDANYATALNNVFDQVIAAKG